MHFHSLNSFGAVVSFHKSSGWYIFQWIVCVCVCVLVNEWVNWASVYCAYYVKPNIYLYIYVHMRPAPTEPLPIASIAFFLLCALIIIIRLMPISMAGLCFGPKCSVQLANPSPSHIEHQHISQQQQQQQEKRWQRINSIEFLHLLDRRPCTTSDR